MWPVKSARDMWSIPRPAKPQSKYKKKDQVKANQVSMSDDKNCKLPKFIKSVSSDTNCKDNRNGNMWPVKLQMDMQSKEPAMQSSFKKKYVPLCSDKNCQSTRCYKKKSPKRPMCGDNKNCQSANIM